MEKKETVSIITPMYKGASLVGETIESVLRQTYDNWEMIIVDDCSPDDGAGIKVVEEYAKKDARIKLIASKVNKGSSGARNEAMRNAKGRYFAFLDSDDIWHCNYLATMMDYIEKNTDTNVAIFYCGYRRMNATCTNELLKPYTNPGKKTFKKLLYHCPIFPSAAVVDTEKIGDLVFFREELRALRDDYVYWLDILSKGFTALGISDVLVDYRMREDSMTESKKKMIKPQWFVYRKILGFNIIKSSFYLLTWAINGLWKYGRM